MRYRLGKPGAAIDIYRKMRFFETHKMKAIAKLFYIANHLLLNCAIPPTVEIGENCQITHSMGIVLHQDTHIGDRVIIGHNVTFANARVDVGNDCFIGAGAVIIGPVTIGNNVKIGANTVVNFDVPDNSTVVGIKGRIISNAKL